MSRYTYRIYYKWNEPSASDPFAEPKTLAQVEDALRQFPNELSHRLHDHDAKVETSEVRPGLVEVNLFIDSVASEEQINAALATTLQRWRLCGEALESTDRDARFANPLEGLPLLSSRIRIHR